MNDIQAGHVDNSEDIEERKEIIESDRNLQ